jgi:5-methylcytosine-specific restriction endonuclease McrA
MIEKTCYKCGITKTEESFEKTKAIKSGYTNRCKSCKTASNSKATKAFHRMREKQTKYPTPIETDRFEVAQIFDLFGGKCAYCHVEESEETGTLHLEHIVPLKKDGRHHVSNLVIACKKCNTLKHDKALVNFFRLHPAFTGEMLDFIFMYVARFSGRTPEEVAREFHAEVDEDGKTPRK